MKPDQELNVEEINEDLLVAGDVIGDTAYSERFVLKILLKLANLDTLKDEILEKSFEDDLCTLWDMTAERDVVLYLLRHDVLNLFNFALPIIEVPRILEIIVGIIANMCCHKEVVDALLKIDNCLSSLLEYIMSDDTLILIQVLRLVNSNLFLIGDDIYVWMGLFKTVNYSKALYFILRNSSSKDLLVTALENFNTICTYCNTDCTRIEYFEHFVTLEALESLITAFTEVTYIQKDSLEKDELERLFIITLQMTLNLVGFDKSLEIYKDIKENVATVIQSILDYYEDKFVNQREIDTDLLDIIDSSISIVNSLQISEICEPDKYVLPCYSMWKALHSIKSDQNGSSDFENDEKELQEYTQKLKTPLCTLICVYLVKCQENNLLKVLDNIEVDYDDIINSVEEEEVKAALSKRADNYRMRLKENVDS